MNIAFVSTLKGSAWGGSEELWTAAANRALDRGHRVMISRYQWDQTPPRLAALIERGATASLRPRRTSRLARLLPITPRWMRDLRVFGPETMCISQGGAYECAGHRSMGPLLKWLGGSGPAGGAGVGVMNLIQFNSRDAGLGTAAAARARWLYQRAACNAFVAQENADIASERLGMSIPRSRVVVNPVNLADLSSIPAPPGPPAPVRFAIVARIDCRTKAQDVLFAALARPAWLAREWSLSLYGQGKDEAMLGDLARSLGIASRVHFRGHTDDIRAVWAEHHALLLPSRAEGTPLAMVEAMVLGRPVLVCDVGGCAGWVSDAREGAVAARCSVQEVGAALDRLWSWRDGWATIGEAARARALRQLGPDPGGAVLDMLEGLKPPG